LSGNDRNFTKSQGNVREKLLLFYGGMVGQLVMEEWLKTRREFYNVTFVQHTMITIPTTWHQ